MKSIVIAVYLREEGHMQTVLDTLENTLETMPKDAELIVVDDGSLAPLYEKYKKMLPPFVKVIRKEKNEGVSAAWNTGKNAAKGEYVAIINDDVLAPKGWLDKLAEGFEDSLAGVSAPLAGGPAVRPFVTTNKELSYERRFYPGYFFMLKRDRFFEDFDETFKTNCGDTDYWHRLIMSGLKCVRVHMGIWHKEGGVVHKMDYERLSKDSIDLFIKKWGFHPTPVYY